MFIISGGVFSESDRKERYQHTHSHDGYNTTYDCIDRHNVCQTNMKTLFFFNRPHHFLQNNYMLSVIHFFVFMARLNIYKCTSCLFHYDERTGISVANWVAAFQLRLWWWIFFRSKLIKLIWSIWRQFFFAILSTPVFIHYAFAH